ncbi:hypothetical protein J437_LFUL008318 [Ladona fulva]|uniref:Uncharacterized protein n=1 Tax=Ladona fulva TaxID=123851 RepID=A0A8K0K6T9_LADFU|nr:hypothetical protein J437_LFUL008318 [Ladona fulva]
MKYLVFGRKMIEKDEVTTPEKSNADDDRETENEQISDDAVDMVEEELEALNSHLDKLGTALDNLERKNDDIHAQLVELLEANRQVKMQFQAESPANINEGPQ